MSNVSVSVGTVGLCDGHAREWIQETTGVEVVPPKPGDTIFQLWPRVRSPKTETAEPWEPGATEETDQIARAEELVLLHCSSGALSQRATHLLFTFWRIADIESEHPQHPGLELNPEVQSPGRVFSALAAGVRGASHAALRWSSDPLADLCRCITSSLWESITANAVEQEDSVCRDAIARQPWADVLVSILVKCVLNSTVTAEVAKQQSWHAKDGTEAEKQEQEEAAKEAMAGVRELPESLLDAHAQQQQQIREDVERRRIQRADALRKFSGGSSEAIENENAGWDGGPVSHASYQSLYALRWMCRHDGLATKVVQDADATQLLHFLGERALRPQRLEGPGCSCGRRPNDKAESSCAASSEAPSQIETFGNGQYWELTSDSPSFDLHCHFCGRGTSQRLDDVFSILSTFMLLDDPTTTELKGPLLCKLLDRAEMLIDATSYMQEVSATDYDEWQFGMFAALLPRVYDQGWVYASHGCEESSFVISAAVTSDEGSKRAGEIITKLLSNADSEVNAGTLSILIALCRFSISFSRGSKNNEALKRVVHGLLRTMQPFVDLVEVNWSAIWFANITDLLDTFERGFFWGQNRVHPTDSTSLPPGRSGYFIAPTSTPAQIPAVLAAHALHKLATAGVGLDASEFEQSSALLLTPLLMSPTCAELCQLGFRTSDDHHCAFTSMSNFESFCIMSVETLASLGANAGNTATVHNALTTFAAQLFDDPDLEYALTSACFLQRIVTLGRDSELIPDTLLVEIQQSLSEKESYQASCLLRSIAEAVPAGFLGIEDLHAGIAGLFWLVTADHLSLKQSFCSDSESAGDPLLRDVVQQFGQIVKLSSLDGHSAPWLGSAMADIIAGIVTRLGCTYGKSVLTDSPQHISDSLVAIIGLCTEFIVSSASAEVSTNAKRRLVEAASTVLNSVLRVLSGDDGQSALLDLGLVVPFSLFQPLVMSMNGNGQQEEFAEGAVELLGFIIQHEPTLSASCCNLLANLLLRKPRNVNAATTSARSLALAFALASGEQSRLDCVSAIKAVIEAGRHGTNRAVWYPSGLLENLRRLFQELEASSSVATRVLQLFLDPAIGLLSCLMSDMYVVEDAPFDHHVQDTTSISDVLHALIAADAELVSSALLLQSPSAINILVGLMVRLCHQADAQLQDGESVTCAPRRRTKVRVLLQVFHRFSAIQLGLDALESNHEALARLIDALGEVVVWRMYTSGNAASGGFSQSPWLAATLIARLAPVSAVTQKVKALPWLLRQSRAVIVANARPGVVAAANSRIRSAPGMTFGWEKERLLWLACLKKTDAPAASSETRLENANIFQILPREILRRIICHLCPVSRLLAPIYSIAGALISEMLQRHEQAHGEYENTTEWTGLPNPSRYAKRPDAGAPALSIEKCVPRLMQIDAGPWTLRTSIVCQGTLSTFDAFSRRGTIQLLPGEFATFESTELFLAAGRHGQLLVNQMLEFELEEVEEVGVSGVFRAVRICGAGGGCVAQRD